jgi:PIN domain nuclease of toxin-antitoxin system
MESESAQLIISEATFWEISIKHSLGKLELLGGLESLRKEWLGQEAAQPLGIEWRHILAVSNLPLIHRDPFDRMLIAQAMEENLTILTCDENIRKYPGVSTIW